MVNKIVLISMTVLPVALLLFNFKEYESDDEGEMWALLVAGSWGYDNYRHEADICHAYQILKQNGFKDANVVVFMSGDAANHGNNPRKGTLINNNNGIDVYNGVHQDYVGDNATTHNLKAVLLGNKSQIKDGSGKVIDSGPNDRIFFFYSDHGNEAAFQMPSPRSDGSILKTNLAEVLQKKYAMGGYKSMVFYINACRAGNIGDYISPRLNIYVVTSSARGEDSLPTYCSQHSDRGPPYAPFDYNTCLASEFGAAWMEHSENIDTRRFTLDQQFQIVKQRVISSNVTQHGSLHLGTYKLSCYIGWRIIS